MALARPIEPITATDDELRAALARRRPPGAAAGPRPRHRRPVAAAPGAAHRPAADGRGPGRADARATGGDPRAGARDARSRSATVAASPPPMPTGPDLDADPRVHGRRAGDRRVPADDARGAGADRRPPRAAVAQGRRQPGQAVPGRRSSAPACRASSPPTAWPRPTCPYVVLDKNADVGGTWLENSYPGCRVDIPNHYYSYSFAQRDDWPLYYSPRLRAATSTSASASTSSASAPTSASTPRSRRSSTTTTSATWTVCTVGPGRRRGGRSRPTP